MVPINDFVIHCDATIDNEFNTTCTMIFDTVLESHTIGEEEDRSTKLDKERTTLVESSTIEEETIYDDITHITCITTTVDDNIARTFEEEEEEGQCSYDFRYCY